MRMSLGSGRLGHRDEKHQVELLSECMGIAAADACIRTLAAGDTASTAMGRRAVKCSVDIIGVWSPS